MSDDAKGVGGTTIRLIGDVAELTFDKDAGISSLRLREALEMTPLADRSHQEREGGGHRTFTLSGRLSRFAQHFLRPGDRVSVEAAHGSGATGDGGQAREVVLMPTPTRR